MARSTQTINREKKRFLLLKLNALTLQAISQKKKDIDKIPMPELKRFFDFLMENVKMSEDDKKFFYFQSKKKRGSMLPGEDMSGEGEDFDL